MAESYFNNGSLREGLGLQNPMDDPDYVNRLIQESRLAQEDPPLQDRSLLMVGGPVSAFSKGIKSMGRANYGTRSSTQRLKERYVDYAKGGFKRNSAKYGLAAEVQDLTAAGAYRGLKVSDKASRYGYNF